MATGKVGGRRLFRFLLGYAALLGMAGAPAPAGAQQYPHSTTDLGPNPGHIPMSPNLERRLDRFFGMRRSHPASSTPRPSTARRAAPAAARPQPRPRADLLALGLDSGHLRQLRAAGFALTAEHPGGLTRLGGPPGMPEDEALALVRNAAPGAVADGNHIFRLATGEQRPGEDGAAAPEPACASAPSPLIAIVDTGVDPRNAAVERRETLRGRGRAAARTEHGTAVAARLIGALPDAQVVVLDIFHRSRDEDVADAFDLAAALARAAEIGAAIANVSAVGPANEVVDRVGAQAAASGVLFVVAAGNDGPDAPPLYPAAYPWALAVTAVDGAGEAWSRAAAGPHIAFAAPGVDVPLPHAAGGQERTGSGSSLAAPVVTAMLAAAGPAPDHAAQINRLARRARDRGEPGRDPTYGFGVVELDVCVLQREPRPPAAAAAPAPRGAGGRTVASPGRPTGPRRPAAPPIPEAATAATAPAAPD